MHRYISIIICWLTIGLHISAESNIAQQDCAFCKHAFAGCYCQGTNHDYKIICEKTAHDFWSLSFCSPSSIHLIWEHPEVQPRAINQFPELPSVLDIQLDGLPAIDLDMSKIDKLEQLRIVNPRCDCLPKIKYPKIVQSLKLTADRDLKIPDTAFNNLKKLNNLTLEGRGIKEFPLTSLQAWRTSTNRTDDKLICNIKNTSVRKTPKLSSDRYDVKSDIPAEPVSLWSRLFDFNKKDSNSNRECTQPPSTPIRQHSQLTEHGQDNIPLSFGPEPVPSSSSITETITFVSNATSDPSRLESLECHRDDMSVSIEQKLSLSTPSSDSRITSVSIAATTQGDSESSGNGEDATPCTNPLCSSSTPRDASEYSNNGQDEIPLSTEQELAASTSSCHAQNIPTPASAVHSSSHDRNESNDFSISGRQESLTLTPFIDGSNTETISGHPSITQQPNLIESGHIGSAITRQGIELSPDHTKCQHDQDPRCIDHVVKNNIEHEADINQVQYSENQAQPTNSAMGFDLSDLPHADRSNQQDLQLKHIYDSRTSYADESSSALNVSDQMLYVEEVHEPNSRSDCCCNDSQVEALDNNSEAKLDSIISDEKIESEQESVGDIVSPQYNKSSAVDSEDQLNFPVTQIGPKPGHSPTKSGNKTAFIMMILFGTFGSTLAVVISCIRHRPRRSLILKSKLDEEWIRAQAEPSRSV